MKRYLLMLDLVDDADKIAAYEAYHKQIPEAIAKSIFSAGIEQMEIHRFGNRMVMEMITQDDFSFEHKAAMDQANPEVQAWESLMSQFQSCLPGTPINEKWVRPSCIFSLKK